MFPFFAKFFTSEAVFQRTVRAVLALAGGVVIAQPETVSAFVGPAWGALALGAAAFVHTGNGSPPPKK